ncbi:MerR family transcriptional regulator [Enterococcus sp. AZ109]|uniref:MerR family transcriptional regulator n=1 Tax=Enterococcus sp. AZ109 TaxID=2774634 RepID=UPI003F20D787
MEARYKIGTISKLLGIPIQTLHYYEKCGFVTPSKDEHSNYRYYNTWDINYLLDSKFLRSFEFPNTVIEQIVNKDDVQSIYSRYESQEYYLLHQIQHYQGLLEELHTEKTKLARFEKAIGKLVERRSPEMFLNSYRYNNQFRTMDSEEEVPQLFDWISHFPYVKATFMIDVETNSDVSKGNLDYWWGFSVSPKKARELSIPTFEIADYFPARNSLYTVFKASAQDTFVPSVVEQVLKPIIRQGYEIVDKPIGRLIIRSHQEDRYERVFEIWVPVEE